MSKNNILFINGTADDRNVRLLAMRKDGSAVIEYTGSVNIYGHIQSDLFNKTLLTFDTNPKQEIKGIRFDAVFNQISDPDSHKIALLKAEGMQKQLPADMPFFNTPENIRKTTRDNIYKLLQGIDKLHVPKTVKINPKSPSDIYVTIDKEDFKFPVIFRQAGDHGGISTIRVDDETEQFYAFPLDGRDYYLTQFVDYADADGIYAKHRLVVVDGEVFLNDAMFSKKWMVHNQTQIEKIKMEEDISKRFHKEIKPLIQPIISEIHHRLGLDYVGIDCHIDNEANLLIFEINANMSVFRGKNREEGIFKKHAMRTYHALIDMLSSK